MRRILITYVILGCLLQLILIACIHMMVRWEEAYIAQLDAPNPPLAISQLSVGSIPEAYGIPLLILLALIVNLIRKAPDKKLADLLGVLTLSTILITLLQIAGFLALFWGMWASGLS
jgi:hypothetical protein